MHSFSRRNAHGKRLCFFQFFLFSFLLFPPRFLALNAIGEYFQCDMGFSLFIYQKGNSCTRLNHLLPIILCLLGKKMQEKRNFNAKVSYSSDESRVSFNYFLNPKKGEDKISPKPNVGSNLGLGLQLNSMNSKQHRKHLQYDQMFQRRRRGRECEP